MEQLLAIIIGIAALDAASAVLEHQGGTRAVAGLVLGLTGGAASGLLAAVILALMVTPGACIAVLCPTCYSEPQAGQVWAAGVVYFSVLGTLCGLLPGVGFRSGFGLGAAVTAIGAVGYWSHYGAGATILLGVALAAIGWGIHRALAQRLRGTAGADSPPGRTAPTPVDFWDGSTWRRPPAGEG